MGDTLKRLVVDGQGLYEELNQFKAVFSNLNGYSFSLEVNHRHEAWLRAVHDLFADGANKLPISLFGQHTSFKWTGDPNDQSFSMVTDLLAKQIDFLKSLQSKVEIHVSADGSLYNQTNGKSYRFRPTSKRFKLIKFLIEERIAIPARIMRMRLEYGDTSGLSKEKRAINKALLENIGVKEFIVRRGYELNPQYEVVWK